MHHLIAPSSMIEVARPQSAIVRERGRALIIQAEPQPPRYTILTKPIAGVQPARRKLVFMPHSGSSACSCFPPVAIKFSELALKLPQPQRLWTLSTDPCIDLDQRKLR
jgi:hypothetical protein